MAPQLPQQSDTQTSAPDILGPVTFKLSDLSILGTTQDEALDIVSTVETVKLSVKITFNDKPLTQLLLCLGMKLSVDFAFEGFGKAAEVDVLNEKITTEKDKFVYIVETDLTPSEAGLTQGFYEVAATVKVSSPAHKDCGQKVLGIGFIKEFSFQVYEA
jgi:hypothetical protein